MGGKKKLLIQCLNNQNAYLDMWYKFLDSNESVVYPLVYL